MKKLIRKAKSILIFVCNHHLPLVIFKRYSTRLKLINLRATRFATNFLMLDRLVEVKVALEQCIIDVD